MRNVDGQSAHPRDWLELHRSGDPDGARRIFEYFSKQLCNLAQRHMTSRVRQRVDGEDVVQSVFRTFFVRDSKGQFHIEDSDELWRLLVKITLRKARGIWRTNTAGQRSVTKEVGFDDGDPVQLSLISREPSAVEAIILADEIEMLLDGLPQSHVQALELRMGGYSPTEAAELMGLSRQAFYRLIEPLKKRLMKRDETLFNVPLDAESSTERDEK